MSQAPRCKHGEAERGIYCPKCHQPSREMRLESALRAIYENVPRFTYFFPRPEGFEPVHYDVWLHDLIDLALKPERGSGVNARSQN